MDCNPNAHLIPNFIWILNEGSHWLCSGSNVQSLAKVDGFDQFARTGFNFQFNSETNFVFSKFEIF